MASRRGNWTLGNRGITLIELLIAAVIGSMITVLLGSLITHFAKTARLMETRLKEMGEDLVGARAIWYDVRRSGTSFNLVTGQLDDAGRPFFDFIPDFPCPRTRADCRRTLTLRPPAVGVAATPFVFALTKGELAPPTAISPVKFFDMPEPAATLPLGSAGPISFQMADLMTELTNIDPRRGDANSDRKMRKEGRLLRFYSPFYQREFTGFGLPNMMTPPRMLSFVGVVTGTNGASIQPLTSLPQIPVQTRPDLSSVSINTVEKFFRHLPPVGGEGAFGLVVPIEVARYRVERWQDPERLNDARTGPRDTGQLVRDVYENGAWVKARVIARPVLQLTLLRDTISEPSIKPTLRIDRVEYREIMRVKEN